MWPNVVVQGRDDGLPAERPSGTVGSAYTRRVVAAMHEDLCEVLREHGKDSVKYEKQLDRASHILRGSLPELLTVFLDYSSSSPR